MRWPMHWLGLDLLLLPKIYNQLPLWTSMEVEEILNLDICQEKDNTFHLDIYCLSRTYCICFSCSVKKCPVLVCWRGLAFKYKGFFTNCWLQRKPKIHNDIMSLNVLQNIDKFINGTWRISLCPNRKNVFHWWKVKTSVCFVFNGLYVIRRKDTKLPSHISPSVTWIEGVIQPFTNVLTQLIIREETFWSLSFSYIMHSKFFLMTPWFLEMIPKANLNISPSLIAFWSYLIYIQRQVHILFLLTTFNTTETCLTWFSWHKTRNYITFLNVFKNSALDAIRITVPPHNKAQSYISFHACWRWISLHHSTIWEIVLLFRIMYCYLG